MSKNIPFPLLSSYTILDLTASDLFRVTASGTYIAPACQPLTQSGKAWLSYWWLSKFRRPFSAGEGFYALVFLQALTELYQISEEYRTIILAPKSILLCRLTVYFGSVRFISKRGWLKDDRGQNSLISHLSWFQPEVDFNYSRTMGTHIAPACQI